MVSALPIYGVFAVLVGVVYQFLAQPILYKTLGFGRPVVIRRQANCEKLTEFEACEDGWYHQPSGLLYLACSSLKGRQAWLPNADHFDLINRPEDDYVAIFDTKGTGSVASRTTKIKPKGFTGSNGKGSYNLHAISVHLIDDETMRIFLVNHRPQPEPMKYGANSTIELFESKLGSSTMQHVKTFADPVIATPNNLAPTGPDSFVFSNDHYIKVGQLKMLDVFFAKASVGACNKDGCKKVLDPFQYPNGLTGGTQFPSTNPRVVYIASSTSNILTVAESQADGSLVKLDEIPIDYPLDNLSMDVDGNIWAAGFPKILQLLAYFKDPAKLTAPTVLLKISKNKGKDAFYGHKYNIENVVEDDGTTLTGLTFVEHDTERDLLFAGGVFTPYLAVCKI
ncbi:hypothetical protein CBS101457_005328 [Exobasidium rhododendri]|nr:hypothetical protein CBS101457_005328 [Exobasidium rhododendri]